MAADTFTIFGDVNVQITITEVTDPISVLTSLKFQIDVLDDTGSIGDLNAIFFDLYNDSLTNTLMVEGADITGTVFKEDGVTKIDSYTNMSGEVITELGKFDGGIQFGTAAIGSDDIRSTTFTLSSSAGSLSLADFSLQDFGVRLTSVGADGGSRDDSLKLGGTAPEFGAEPEVLPTAINDTMTVTETATFIPVDQFDFLDSGETSVTANDTYDGGAYTGNVWAVNGDGIGVGQIVTGSNGGTLIMYADGSFDFLTNDLDGFNSFGDLNDGQERLTTFNYSIDGGSTATFTVTVTGIDDEILPPPPPPIEIEIS